MVAGSFFPTAERVWVVERTTCTSDSTSCAKQRHPLHPEWGIQASDELTMIVSIDCYVVPTLDPSDGARDNRRGLRDGVRL